MCGISGFVAEDTQATLESMCVSLKHRGPDNTGVWLDAEQGIGLGHTRLAIIDLTPAGHQPMTNSNKTIHLSFNGEIYNFRELKLDLEKKGYVFKSQCDSEVLVYLYEEYGIDCLKKLNGMFALSIWDSKNKSLFLARDHAGIKPLYYWSKGPEIYFASEIKALLKATKIPRHMNHQAVYDYLRFLWVPGSETMFKDVMKIEPGHMLVWKDGNVEIKRWFELAYDADITMSEDQCVEQLGDIWIKSVERCMISDAPLGAFLSGGVDSSAIVSTMRELYPERDIHCYTARIDARESVEDDIGSDFEYAQQVAQIKNLKLKSFELKPNVVELLPKVIHHMDEPDADPAALPTYLISECAKKDGIKVLLSGTGGDELFFGYRSHQAIRFYQMMQCIPKSISCPILAILQNLFTSIQGAGSPIPRRFAKLQRGLRADDIQRIEQLMSWSEKESQTNILAPAFMRETQLDTNKDSVLMNYYNSFRGSGELNRFSHVLIQSFLGAHNFLYTDKMSMASSIEVRVPFMDRELMAFSAKIPEKFKLKGSVTKHIFKKMMQPHLPREILYRPKMGFGVPLRHWIKNDLRELIGDVMSLEKIKSQGVFDPKAIEHILSENQQGKQDHAYLIYAILNLSIWQDQFIG
ncbi:MAG: asparagine synthase (glutamine-hydrolyzing) [Candidatus Omnitrophota bacterium]|jgi:asparagine synthase (glutamine-hydrolysing)